MRILFVSPRPLRPARRGHQLRALRALEELAGAGHAVTLLAPAGGAPPAAGEPRGIREVAAPVSALRGGLGAAAALLGGRPAQAGLVGGPAFLAAFDRLAGEADLVILQLSRLAGLAERLERRGGPPWIADLVDSLALNLERRADRDRAWARPLLRLEARRLLAAERRMAGAAVATWLVCERDRAWLEARSAGSRARFEVVPVGIDPVEPPPARARRERPLACLTGNLGYFPTRDGARWLLTEVWPELASRGVPTDLLVAGSRPGRSLARAVRRAGGVLHADPTSLGEALARATLALVPLFVGSGVPIKLLEAWAAGVPVVATPWAAAGAGGVDGVDHLAAERPADWARAIERLAADPELASRLASGGRARLLAEHSRQRLRASLESSLARL